MALLKRQIDTAVRMVHEVEKGSEANNWEKTKATLLKHWRGGEFSPHKAMELIQSNVRKTVRELCIRHDKPALDLAATWLYFSMLREYLGNQPECKHPRAYRQGDEKVCPDCRARWDANEGVI